MAKRFRNKLLFSSLRNCTEIDLGTDELKKEIVINFLNLRITHSEEITAGRIYFRTHFG